MKKQQSIRAACLAIAVCSVGMLTVSCASVGNPQKKTAEQNLPVPLILTESVLVANGHDLERLFNAWVTPVAEKSPSTANTKNVKFIPVKRAQFSANENAIADGFSRFCSLNGGRLLHEEGRYGDDYRCEKPDSTYIGSMSAVRTGNASGLELQVSYETPLMLKERDEWRKKLEERSARNGPTGWVTTDEGKFRFIRLGGANGRQLIELEGIPIDDIASLTWNDSAVHAKLWNGRTVTSDSGLFQRTPSNLIALGAGGPYPFVILDPKSGKTYLNVYSGIRSIQFDAVEKWVRLPNNAIKITMRSPKYEAELARLDKDYKRLDKICKTAVEPFEMLRACNSVRSAADERARITKLQAEFEGYQSPL